MTKLKEKVNHYWVNGLSIDETKVSVLMMMMVISFGIGIWQVFTVGDLSPNFMQLIFVIIASVTGINVVNRFTNQTNQGSTTSTYENGNMTIDHTQYQQEEKYNNTYDQNEYDDKL